MIKKRVTNAYIHINVSIHMLIALPTQKILDELGIFLSATFLSPLPSLPPSHLIKERKRKSA